jgi:dolichol-phosphate mannosyltransferase
MAGFSIDTLRVNTLQELFEELTMTHKIIIGLPAFNEEDALPSIMKKINLLYTQVGDALRVVIVNDGSTDNTERLLLNYAKEYGYVRFISHSCNLGLGQAMSTLFDYVTEHYGSKDILFTLDADNTHNPTIIPTMVGILKDEDLDLIIASRFTAGGKEIGLSLLRKMCSRGAKLFFKVFFPIDNVNDYSCGFRGYSLGYLKNAIGIYDGRLITCIPETHNEKICQKSENSLILLDYFGVESIPNPRYVISYT